MVDGIITEPEDDIAVVWSFVIIIFFFSLRVSIPSDDRTRILIPISRPFMVMTGNRK